MAAQEKLRLRLNAINRKIERHEKKLEKAKNERITTISLLEMAKRWEFYEGRNLKPGDLTSAYSAYKEKTRPADVTFVDKR